jgi:hypothetical protein
MPIVWRAAAVAFENISFTYPDGRKMFADVNPRIDLG